jgi:hypothetical protein
MNSNGQIRHHATIEERRRCALVVTTQIEELHERIRRTDSLKMKTTWAIAIIELQEIARIINAPLRNVA